MLVSVPEYKESLFLSVLFSALSPTLLSEVLNMSGLCYHCPTDTHTHH